MAKKPKSKDIFKGKLSDFGVTELTITELDKAHAILADYTSSETDIAWARITLSKYDHDFTGKKDKTEATQWEELKPRNSFQ